MTASLTSAPLTDSPLRAAAQRFLALVPAGVQATVRLYREKSETVSVRRGVLEPLSAQDDLGAMVTVLDGGLGYAATSDLSTSGLRAALDRARLWAQQTAGKTVTDFAAVQQFQPGFAPKGQFHHQARQSWFGTPLADRIALVKDQEARLAVDSRLVDRQASLWGLSVDTLLVSAAGADIEQSYDLLVPYLQAVASDGRETTLRSLGGRGSCRQGGLESLGDTGFLTDAPRIAAEAVELLTAPDCPTDQRHVLLMPDQMYLQIHESIGHPLELDRILGDERNYAGTSFVTPDLFGHYQYGSPLLNITFDPGVDGEFASYAFDDEGLPANREFLIQDGILLRGLGSSTSQHRLGLQGVANSRASSWNRPPIDRMANLNMEPGTETLADLIGRTERGILMSTNCSWSIDDSRNKFQFGCEYGRLIEDGQLTGVVKKPNYRGISATFWRNLVGVGDRSTWQVLGSPFCGKGEPNQIIRVGHATPACLFADVDVFGGV
jgi:predicted Zn-dependent protease